MRGLVLFSAGVVLAQSGWGQGGVSADESKIQAVLRDGRTTITLPIRNRLDRPIGADLTLEWLDASPFTGSKVARNLTIQPGETTIEVPLPLPDSASIWLRLRYSLSAERPDAKAFLPSGGILSLSSIAAYVFELRLAHYGSARAGKPLTLQAYASHPSTRQPVANVRFEASLENEDIEIKPAKAQITGGNAEFLWNIPASGSGAATVEITAHAGDFHQTQFLRLDLNEGNPTGRIQSDKPIYQPGQKLHLRGVVFSETGVAKADAQIELTVEDPDAETVHKARLTTSRFGVVHDDWTIPSIAAPGQYRIKLELEEEGDTIAQHTVKISRYELPNFAVTAKTSKPAYLLKEPASVDIRGMYLFGKPVPKGHVKIVRTKEERWNPKTRRMESDDEAVTEGEADDAGHFTAVLDLKEQQVSLQEREHERFEDLHYAVYFTDPGRAGPSSAASTCA